MDWEDSVSVIKGVGKKRVALLAENNIKTVKDVLQIYPKRYIDRRQFSLPQDIELDKPTSIKAMVLNSGDMRRIPGKCVIFSVKLLWESTKITGIFFNQPYLKGKLLENNDYYFYGKIEKKNSVFKIINPQFALVNDYENFLELIPVYPKVNGISNGILTKMIKDIIDHSQGKNDDLPESIRINYQLETMESAFKGIHAPKTEDDIKKGIDRLKFNEALMINIGILSNSGATKKSKIVIDNLTGMTALINQLPFELTDSQKSVMDDILSDLKSGQIMNRLIQGDVGSGKTVIAIITGCIMAQNGYQMAYMAPTEILAQQHGRNFKKILSKMGITVEIITGSLKTKERREISRRIVTGETSVIIGTHALIQESVEYYNLGMVITDEQHRFGVKQRGKFALKGDQPHTMVMSATPIPRTLALILYGDLAVSYIDELPKGRKPIKTYCYDEVSLNKILGFLEGEVQKGRQAFIICPFIEASEEMSEVRDIETIFLKLTRFFKDTYQLSFLHSRMLNCEKEETIQAFNQKKIDILVATSIIEVGIDVPNVSVIVILSAERFGLSQLHQLRGRVGRGKHQSYCFLVTNSKSKETLTRMNVIVKNNSGKKIADEDFRLRGPGDYFGLKQHGLPDFKMLNPLEDMEIIQRTKELATTLFDSKQKEVVRYRENRLNEFLMEIEEISLN
jgi:ATP-dependent DNA helicase RecG